MRQDVYLSRRLNGSKINVYVLRDTLRLVYSVCVMELKLVISVIDVHLNQILLGMGICVSVMMVLPKLMENVYQIQRVWATMILIPVLWVVTLILIIVSVLHVLMGA